MGGGVERALRDLDEGRHRAARERLKSLLVRVPADMRVRRLLAEAYRRDGQPTEAGRWGFLETTAATDRERDAFLDHVRYRRDGRIKPSRMRHLLKCEDPLVLADPVTTALLRSATRRRRLGLLERVKNLLSRH